MRDFRQKFNQKKSYCSPSNLIHLGHFSHKYNSDSVIRLSVDKDDDRLPTPNAKVFVKNKIVGTINEIFGKLGEAYCLVKLDKPIKEELMIEQNRTLLIKWIDDGNKSKKKETSDKKNINENKNKQRKTTGPNVNKNIRTKRSFVNTKKVSDNYNFCMRNKKHR